MKMFKRIGAIVLAIGMVVSLSGAAVPTERNSEKETKTISWILPNGGTATNVTWPQPLYTGQVPECGESFTIQTDVYKYNNKNERATVDALDDDGILTKGEDYSVIKSWSYSVVPGPACPVIEEGEEVVITDWFEDTADCDALTVTARSTTTTTPWTSVDGVKDYGEPAVVTNTSVRDATLAECPAEEPPVIDPPVVTPPVVVPPVVVPESHVVTSDGYAVPKGELG